MQTHEIRRTHPNKKKKLVARGGKRGKTAGRGGKGQTARAGHSVRPAMRDIIKKLPKLRGHGKNRAKSVFYRGPEAVVNVNALNVFKDGEVVNVASLIAKGLIPSVFGKNPKVKILGTGEITVKVTVEECTISESAKAKIEKVGGTITAIPVSEKAKAVIAKTEEKKMKKATAKKPSAKNKNK